MGGFVVVSEQTGFCNSCHIMERYYVSWQVSAHKDEASCLECHMQPGTIGHIKGKINGMAQAIDCMVGRTSTKPNANIFDASCLRSDCHSIDELEILEIEVTEERRFRFTHQGHVGQEVAGITITCGVCHSHFEGEEHFTVNTQVCFTCHFLKNNQNKAGVVDNECQSCHEVPGKPVKRGEMEVLHTEFVLYEANCEESCHKKQLEIDSTIQDSVCLMCHDFRDPNEVTPNEMHQLHSDGNKVECFACHGGVKHKTNLGAMTNTSVAAMLDCQGCHSDTHEAQRTIYAAEQDLEHKLMERILSPMFLTHVECKGCHIEKKKSQEGIFDSVGTVAQAVPEACDHCHEPGTGDEYIPFWQEQTKQLFEKVNAQVAKLEEKAKMEPDKLLAEEMADKARQARALLDAVVADGSWGVHNLKYTEAMIIKAKDMVKR